MQANEVLGRPPSVWRSVAFAVLSMLAMSTAVVFVPGPLVENLSARDSQEAARRWQTRLLGLLSAGGDAFLLGAITARDEAALDLFRRSSDAHRLKLIRADGTVFWSTRAEDFGARITKPHFAEVVTKGESHVVAGQRPAATVDPALPPGDRLVHEVYVPVMVDGRFAGAIAFHADVTEEVAARVVAVRNAFVAVAGLGLLASVGLIAVVMRASRRRERFMAHLAERDRAAMEQDRRLSREVRLLSELNEWLQASKSLEELFGMVQAFMGNIFGACSGSLYVYSNSRDVLDGACCWNNGHLHAHIRPDECWGLRRGRTYVFGANEIDFQCAHLRGEEVYNYCCIPILAHGETVGLLHLVADPALPADMFVDERRLAQLCAEQISLAIANVRLRDQLRDQSIRDPLTGLHNRRHFLDILRRSVDAARRNDGDVALVSIDVDHFKRFNDNHGHDAGDMVLRAVGAALQAGLQGDALAFRVGGEEFAAVLPGANAAEALRRADMLRQAVERIVVRYGDRALPRISVSGGIASWPDHGDLPQQLVKAADDALYAAKAAGRNQICLAAPPQPEAPETAPPRRTEPGDMLAALAGPEEAGLPGTGETGHARDAGAVRDTGGMWDAGVVADGAAPRAGAAAEDRSAA